MLTIKTALEISVRAIEKAETNSANICVCVVDRGGNVLVQLRMEDAPFHSLNIAYEKAATAVSFQIETSEWKNILAAEHLLVSSALIRQEKFCPIGGGCPIYIGERLVGAIGVSGATEDVDIQCAKFSVSISDEAPSL